MTKVPIRSGRSYRIDSPACDALVTPVLARELERVGKAGSLDGAGPKVEALETEFAILLEEVRAFAGVSN